MKIVVLGGGRVGAAMVQDLALEPSFEIKLVDASERALAAFANTGIRTEKADLRQAEEIGRVVADQDLVVGAVPGPMGFATVRAVIQAGKPIVDISFFEEDAFELDGLAREQAVPVLVDCGVAPGASNLILGRLEVELEHVDRFACYVGGLPTRRLWPYEYKAPFSPIDVIAEYTRPVRMRELGHEVVRPALGRSELMDFEGIGTLEAFETDGLRSLLRTSKAPNLVEKTLRYPGHRAKMELLRETGFLSDHPVTLKDGTTIRPVDLAAHLLFPLWQLDDGEDELTVMRVEVEGRRDGRSIRHRFDLLDRRDAETGVSSMARTTGYTCTGMVRVVAEGLYDQPGVSPPELVGRDRRAYDRLMSHLAERGIQFSESVEEIE